VGTSAEGLEGADPEAPWADQTSPRTADAELEVFVAIERAEGENGPLILLATVAGASSTAEVEEGTTEAVLRVPVRDVELWWPTGYGPQPLYDVEVELGGQPLAVPREHAAIASVPRPLDRWHGRVGFRSVELDTRREQDGARLGFVINGRAISVRGANWIPDDCFVTRVGPDRYRRRLEEARAANMNLLRVWGGGIYESEDFYNSADELGLLVWQDFLLSCAAYSEEEPLRSEIEAETREAVTRLARHPSLAVWSGGNENIWGYEEWGWEQRLAGKTWGSDYYFGVLPAIVGELDPGRPYMAGSPWSFGYEAPPNDPRYGSVHVWDVWNRRDYTTYRDYKPQFVAEFGFQGPPAWSTLTTAISDRPLSTNTPNLVRHQKATNGMEKLARWLEPHFPEPRSFEDWHWATSLNQARAITLAVEYWRSLGSRCRGTIVWQLNDCWPVISWSAIDGAGRRKPLWYALRRVYADRLLTVQRGERGARSPDQLAAVAVNDSAKKWHAVYDVTRQDFGGAVLAKGEVTIGAEPGESVAAVLGRDLVNPDDATREVLVVSGDGHRALWFYQEDKDLALPSPGLAARLGRTADGYDVIVSATSLQRDVALLADRADPDATSDDMLFTLLPGESRCVRVRTAKDLDPALLLSPGVLRSANQLCHQDRR
ncbi:MAG TPA: glycoside hydrolase family 2 protein, partial [Acidimicrobiales bacterium]|nr:glycoside hydrolase family 2 protein [Acidimicrobiales bacterium]